MNVWKAWIGSACIAFAAISIHASDVVTQARASYDKALKSIQDQYTHRISVWPAEYMKQVGVLEASLQKQGNLDGVLQVRNELKRFNETKTIPESALSEQSSELKTIQLRFNTLKEKFSTDKHQGVLDLAAKYETHLKAKQVEMTRANRMDDAIACRNEVTRLQEAPEITAARFVIAVDDDGETKPEPEQVTTTTTKPVETKAPAVELVTESYGKSYFTIHKQGKFPPRPTKGVFKRVSMRSTSNVSGRKVAMSLMINDETEPTRSNGGKRLALKVVTTARVQLKTASSSTVIEKPQLMIQYFAVRTGNNRFGHKKPFEHSYHTVSLPHLSGSPLNVDCPAAGRPPDPDSSYRPVYKHYGVVVSIFDSNGTLVSQESFPTSLKENARTKTHNTSSAPAAVPKELADKTAAQIHKEYELVKAKYVLLSEEIENGRTDEAALTTQKELGSQLRSLRSAWKSARHRAEAAAKD